MPYFSRDDIAQIGTAPGNAPVGALRLSGDNAFAIARAVSRGLEDSLRDPVCRSTHDGQFMLAAKPVGVTNDKRLYPCPARFFLMPAPASYTRENVVEIHLPGSGALLRAALETLIAAGARAAAPGEFTFRAFRNGRLNLGQAEAVESVIRADTDLGRREALARLGDHSLPRVHAWRDNLMNIAAALEASLDFAGEELDEDAAEGLAALAAELAREGAALAGGDAGAGDDLPHVALVGLTNAGKSSLFNALTGDNAVLVSPEASTTRDSLWRSVQWDTVRLRLSDNPGYDTATGGSGGRAADEALGRLGGEDLACWVVDASVPVGEEVEQFVRRLPGQIAIVLHKCDLPCMTSAREIATLAESRGVTVVASAEASSATGTGISELRSLIAGLVPGLTVQSRWNRRETLELRAALECCRAALEELSGPGRLELAADDVRRGVAAFSRALGEGYAEEALGRIFSRFCIGK